MNRYEAGNDRELVGTCAIAATVLAGISSEWLEEHGRKRSFSVMWISDGYCCVWDSGRASYVHVHATGDHWRLYDMLLDHSYRVDWEGKQYQFVDDTLPDWSVQVLVQPHEAHASGPDGEHCFAIQRRVPGALVDSYQPSTARGWQL